MRFKILFLLFISISGGQFLQAQSVEQSGKPSDKPQGKDARKVAAAFKEYQSAILNDQAFKAIQVVDQRTHDYYQNMLGTILSADSLAVEALPLLDRMTVLMTRYRVPLDTLLRINGDGLFLYAIRNGMVVKSGVMNLSCGPVTVTGDFASAQMLVNQELTPLEFHFYRENKQWRINLPSVFSVAQSGLQGLIASEGITENQFIQGILTTIPGQITIPQAWQPLK